MKFSRQKKDKSERRGKFNKALITTNKDSGYILYNKFIKW